MQWQHAFYGSAECLCADKGEGQLAGNRPARSRDYFHTCHRNYSGGIYQHQQRKLKKQNFGQDLPYLLSMTPSAITTSDAGAGIGYTTLRVRGTDGTRINVTANGIPINDAESHTVFWVNLPDFASSVKDMQIQRGAGTSTNGAGAFGASINMQTGDFS